MSPAANNLDAYLDGALSPQDAASFERELAADPALAAEVALQRRIDVSLRELYAVPASSQPVRLDAAAETATAVQVATLVEPESELHAAPRPLIRHSPTLRLAMISAVAAAIGIVGAVWLSGIMAGDSTTRFSRPELMAMDYREQVQLGFVPSEVCTTNEAFAEWTAKRFGQPMQPSGLPASTTLAGWSYSKSLGGYVGMLLARVNGREVLVFMDVPTGSEAGGKSDQRVAGRISGLRTFERHLGKVRLIEVTPLDQPMIVDSIVPAPDAKPPA
jgi:anti-sigma factor RsiW